MLSYMIPPSEEASGKTGSASPCPQPASNRQHQPLPLIHKARGRPQRPGVEPPPPPATNGHANTTGRQAGGMVEQVPVNGQHHSATTTVVVNDGGGTTTTTTFSSTSNINGTVHTTKKIIKTHRDTGATASAVSHGGMSTDSSASSLSTAASEQANTPTSASTPKTKLLANGTKNPGLKRVSFGSSKGSMVETLIYESPLQEEPELTTPTYDHIASSVIDPSIIENDPAGSAGADRVRVTFFESSKPQLVEGGDVLTPEDLDAPDGMATDAHGYVRQNSTDSGWDNPFRPDGDLSREADEIVELIKGGKPITQTPLATPASPIRDAVVTAQHSSPVTSTPRKNGANGSAKDKPSSPGNVDVKRGTVTGGDSAQVEHVTLKKKPKCKCCIVQ